MGRFLDEPPAKTYKGRFLDEPQTVGNNSYKGHFLDEAPVREPDAIIPPKKTAPAYGGAEGARRFALGGLPAYLTSSGSEDVLPAVGQAAGSPGGFGGSIAGATIGQGARQLVKSIRGNRDSQPRRLFGLGPTAPGIVNDLAGEAAGTAATEGAFRGLGKVIPKISNRMMLSVLKPARDVIKRNPNLGLDAAEAGITGTKSGMISKAEDLISEGEDAFSKVLKGKSGKVSTLNVASNLDEIKRPFQNVGDDASVQAIEEVQNNLLSKGGHQGLVGVEEANQLKRDLYKVVKDSQYGKGVGEIASKQSARKQAAYGLKKEIEGIIPESKGINKKIGTAISAKDALENSIANSKRTVLLPKLAGMGAGGLILSGNPLAGLGVLGGDAAFEFMRSAPMVSGAAKNLLRARKLGKPASIIAREGVRRIFN